MPVVVVAEAVSAASEAFESFMDKLPDADPNIRRARIRGRHHRLVAYRKHLLSKGAPKWELNTNERRIARLRGQLEELDMAHQRAMAGVAP